MMLLIMRSCIVFGVLDSREAPECQGEDDEDGHDYAEGCGDFVTHFEGVVTGGLMFSGMVAVIWKFLRKEGKCRGLVVLAYQVDCDERQIKQ
jgi:hypothetical protein